MEELYKYILENTISGKIPEKVAATIIKGLKKQNIKRTKDIAVIGMHLKMPHANSIEEFWNNIKMGLDCVEHIPEDRKKDLASYLQFKGLDLTGVKYAQQSYIQDIDKFDCEFFQISPKEASLMDPYQRLFLETAWNALEDGGYGGTKLVGTKTGVYVGYSGESMYRNVVSEVEPSSYSIYIPGNLEPIIASRIAHIMDFKGPSMLFNTACSSSLVAVHYACADLINGLCNVAIAGGVKINFSSLESQYKLGIESESGKARTFDDSTDGTGNGEGVVALLLKPLSKAIKDRDHIYGVIKGSYVNQDGSSNGITAPNAAAQGEVIKGAWKDAGVDPETITYIEAHGTGTKLGDVIEIDGIKKAFSSYTSKKQFCGIGSLKTNIGHLDNAAGIAGLSKALLALYNKQLPPSLHFSRPNRNIDFLNTQIYVNDKLRDWESNGARRCGVSSFGLSGTNCHVVLEEAPEINDINNESVNENKNKSFIFMLSAKSEESLIALIKGYNDFFENNKESNLGDIAYTASTGRGHYNYRLAFIVNSIEDLKSRIDILDINKLLEQKIFNKFDVVSSDKSVKEQGEIREDEIEILSQQASKMIEKYNEYDKRDDSILKDICDLYLGGATIDWESIYSGMEYRRVKLPTYPFKRKRCWVNIPEFEPIEESFKENIYYRANWKEVGKGSEDNSFDSSNLLVFEGKGTLSSHIVNELQANGNTIIKVYQGECFSKIDELTYTVSCAQEAYDLLWESMKEKDISKILHLASLDENKESLNLEDVKDRQQKGVFSLFHIIRAMDKNQIKDNADIIIVSDYVNEVSKKEEIIKAENAVLFGLSTIARMENSGIKCKCIDVDSGTDISTIISEIKSEPKEYKIAYRNGIRYSEEIDMLDMEMASHRNTSDRDISIKKGGVYVITGGTGRLGLNIAKHLAAKGVNRVILTSSSGVPERDKWREIVELNEESKLCNIIKSIQQIEALGAGIEIYQADVANLDQMQGLTENLMNRFGKIDGVFHCAASGVGMGESYIKAQSVEAFSKMLSPKIEGTWILDRVTQNCDVDFIMLFSSAITTTGSIRAGAYTAANSYLDSFGVSRYTNCKRMIVLNLFMLDYMIKDVKDMKSVMGSISTDKFLDEIDGILSKDIERVIIGKINFDSEWVSFIEQLPFRFSANLHNNVQKLLSGNAKNHKQNRSGQNKTLQHKIVLKGCSEGYTKTQQNIAQAWGMVLGLDEINIYDDFFKLGGNSILAVRAEMEMEKLSVPADYTHLNMYPTIKELADFIDGVTNAKDESLDSVSLDETQNKSLSEQEIKLELASETNSLNDIEPFNDIYYKTCYSNSFFPIVKYYNKNIASFLTYDIIQYRCETVDEADILDVEYIPFKSPNDIMNDMGIKMLTKTKSEDLLFDIKNAIALGRPVIIWVDCFYISIREDTYQKEHWPHTWLVFGYDDKAGTCSIMEHDKKDNLSYQKESVDFDTVLQAYNGYISNYSDRLSEPSYYEFFVESDSEINEMPAQNEKYNLLKELGKEMLQNKDLIYQRLQQIEAFADKFSEIILIRENNNRIERLISSFNNILNAKYVDRFRMSEMLGEEDIAIKKLDEITDKWIYIRAKLIKALFGSPLGNDILSDLSSIIREIYVCEKEYHDILFQNF